MQLANLIVGGVAGSLTNQGRLADFEELLRPFFVLRRRNLFATAEVGDRDLPARPLNDDAFFVLRRKIVSGVLADLNNDVLSHP